jgi:hypothetical protein
MTTSIQSLQNFYMNNNNFVFECTPFDISYNLLNEPALIDYAANSSLGFPDVSQVAILDIPPEYINNMFIFGNTTIPFNIFGLDELKIRVIIFHFRRPMYPFLRQHEHYPTIISRQLIVISRIRMKSFFRTYLL